MSIRTPLLGLLLAVTGATPAVAGTGLIREQPTVITSAREIQRDTSRPLREILAELPAMPPPPLAEVSKPVPNILPGWAMILGEATPWQLESRAQVTPMGVPAPTPSVSFDGLRIGLGGGGVPPDTTGDVSPAHYFQWVNTSWALFDKTNGNRVSGPNPGNTFFAGFGGLCQTTNRGDPLVLWDDAAQRWVVSQFAFTSITQGPFLQCLAVSTTSDPLGSYHRYAFTYPIFNDYGKLAIWRSEDGTQNAYVLSMHEFVNSTTYGGGSIAVLERDRILNGESAQFLRIAQLPLFGHMPFHVEGTTPMPGGSCPMFVHFDSAGGAYRIWDVCINWSDGLVSFDPNPTVLEGPAFGTAPLNGIPQRDSAIRLDDFQSNTMYLSPIRAFSGAGPREAIGAAFHTVNTDNRAGARWIRFGFLPGERGPQFTPGGLIFSSGFEPETGPAKMVKRLVEAGTYAPGTEQRWMGSTNIDKNGNLAMGYTVSSSSINPDIRITGKLRTDPAGQMRDEQLCTVGPTGAQTAGSNRWGDYSTTGIDPVDDCTFWHTNEYFSTTSASSWNTRICAFRFAECGRGEVVIEPPTQRVAVCSTAAMDPSALVRVAVLGDVSGNATLSASGFPGGVTPGFAPASVAPGAESLVTLTGARALAPGDYQGTLTAQIGSSSDSGSFRFGVSAAAATAPSLTAPANNALGVLIRPILSWGSVSGALQYTVELARDAAFAQIVERRTVSGTSFTPAQLLLANQQYFWRVTPSNYCGNGTTSATFTFTTSAPGVCPAGTSAVIAFQDDVSGDAIAWTTENLSGDAGAMWQKTTPPAGTGLTTRAWVAGNSGTTADQRLVTPAITVPNAPGLVLAYDAHHQYETDGNVDCWDGGFVEVSVAGGAFQPLGNARTLTDPYPGRLSSGNPGSPNEAWCRQPTAGTPVRTIFALEEFRGQSIRLRFRSTADSNTVGPAPAGWSIDNVVVQGCQ
ncbi:MAG: hypothetical protein MUE46_03065 [Xanthomonadales bacterium]|jgi:hypothetical protein|nr:hypothetical protein [Xanthomonadales bacterium]